MSYIPNLTASNSTITYSSITSSTASNYYTITVPPGTNTVHIPYHVQQSVCDHSHWDFAANVCKICGIRAEDLVNNSRKPPPKEFNKYINASDLLEEFIQFLGENKVRKGEVFNIPLEHFVKWLVIRACEEDNEEPNVVLELPSPKSNRCLGCGKFMKKELGPLHNQQCSEWYFRRAKCLNIQN